MKAWQKWAALGLVIAAFGTLTVFALQKNKEAAASPATGAGQGSGNAGAEQEVPMVADAAMYRGNVVGLVKQSGGRALLVLEQVEGTNFGSPSLTVRITEDTVMNAELDQLVDEKAYVEVMYGVSGGAGKPVEGGDQSPPEAITVKVLTPAQFAVFNGEVVEVLDGGAGSRMSLLMTPIGGGEQVIFHVSDETQVYMAEGDIKPGAKLNLLTSGARTMSLPPQGSALEIRPYYNAADDEATATIVD